MGARWQHRGRSPGAVDCAGLILHCAGLLGSEHDTIDYDFADITEGRFRDALARAGFLPLDADTAEPGDLLTFETEGVERHGAVLVEPGFIVHAVPLEGGGGRVIRSRLGIGWRSRLVGAYRFPGVEVA